MPIALLALVAVAVATASLALASRRVEAAASLLARRDPATTAPSGALGEDTGALAAAVGRHLDR
jgi:hypothetical protein